MAYTFEFPLSVYLSFIRFAEHNGAACVRALLLTTLSDAIEHAHNAPGRLHISEPTPLLE
ncbi:uncharacterized protein FFB20_07828 [Fusarium fujikuroi]|nr:uncharacterized protein FFE2_03361 [Fusarium fujikuroi]SCN77822.1 uncharacterized protein FFM5_01700 [Fusarium fujikuroi]SCN87131.1 uncharacterized protein FFB20_07828 [Fusarium fujikuroi]SCN94421.1 uncharacterized protein FFC1_06940 [Fusarium fujikuroi]SCO34211.1 uncharacterized protein FFMR_03392 [Fusarium fujikuroi]